MKIILQMRDRLFVCKDGLPYDVVDGHDPGQRILIKYRQIADIFVGHKLHAKIHGIVWRDGRKIFGHDLRYGCIGRALAFEDHFAGVVPDRKSVV